VCGDGKAVTGDNSSQRSRGSSTVTRSMVHEADEGTVASPILLQLLSTVAAQVHAHMLTSVTNEPAAAPAQNDENEADPFCRFVISRRVVCITVMSTNT